MEQHVRNEQYLNARLSLQAYSGVRPPVQPFSYLKTKMEAMLAVSDRSVGLGMEPGTLVTLLGEVWGILRQYAENHFRADLKQVDDQLFRLFHTKNEEYGDSFAQQGAAGCLVRLSDKIQRCLTIEGRYEVNHESLQDSVYDAINYCILSTILLRELY